MKLPAVEAKYLRWLTPVFVVKVNGKNVSALLEEFLREVSYETAEGLADQVSLSVDNPNHLFTDSRVFAEGNELDLWLGYWTADQLLLPYCGKFVITNQDPDFPEAAAPSFTVRALDPLYRLMDSENHADALWKAVRVKKMTKTRHDPDTLLISDSEVIKAITGAYKLRYVGGDLEEKRRKFPFRRGMTDYDVLKKVSERNAYDYWVRTKDDLLDAEFNWQPLIGMPDDPDGDGPGKMLFRYGMGEQSTLLQFRPRAAVRGQKTKVTVHFWDQKKNEPVEVVVELPNGPAEDPRWQSASAADPAPAPTTGGGVRLVLDGDAVEMITGRTFASEAEAKKYAEARLHLRNCDFIGGSGKVLGYPKLRARQVHTLGGLGLRFSGDYRFTRVRHVWSATQNPTTEFDGYRVPEAPVVDEELAGVTLAKSMAGAEAAARKAAGREGGTL